MGDRVAIPRSFAGSIGVADVQNSLRRHYMPIPINDNATGTLFGGNATTGFNPFQRNLTFERLLAVAYATTTIAETTMVQLQAFIGATTTVFQMVLANATTVTLSYVTNSTAPINANAASGDMFRVVAPVFSANVQQLSVVAVFRERVDP